LHSIAALSGVISVNLPEPALAATVPHGGSGCWREQAQGRRDQRTGRHDQQQQGGREHHRRTASLGKAHEALANLLWQAADIF